MLFCIFTYLSDPVRMDFNVEKLDKGRFNSLSSLQQAVKVKAVLTYMIMSVIYFGHNFNLLHVII